MKPLTLLCALMTFFCTAAFASKPVTLTGLTAHDGLEPTLELTFNQPVAPQMVSQSFEVRQKGDLVPHSLVSQNPSSSVTFKMPSSFEGPFDWHLKPAQWENLSLPAQSGSSTMNRSLRLTDLSMAEGRVFLSFNRALKKSAQELKPYLHLQPEMDFHLTPQNNGLVIEGDFKAGSKVKLTLAQGFDGEGGLNQNIERQLVVPDLPPSVVTTQKGLWLDGTNPRLPLTVTNIDSLEVKLWRVYDHNLPLLTNFSTDQLTSLGEFLDHKVYTVDVAPNTPREYTLNLSNFGPAQGVYLAVVEGMQGDQLVTRDEFPIIVSDLKIGARTYPYGAHLWTWRKDQPLSGVELSVIDTKNGLLASGRTDAHGLLTLVSDQEWKNDHSPKLVLARFEGKTTLLPLSENLLGDWDAKQAQDPTAQWISSRTRWQPGEKAELFLLSRTERGQGRQVDYQWHLLDPSGKVVLQGAAPTDRRGLAAVTVPLAENLASGTYILEATYDSTPLARLDLEVATFVPSTIEAHLTSGKTWSLEAEFTYGGPAAGLTYQANATITASSWRPQGLSSWTLGSADFEDQTLDLGEGKLNGEGKATLEALPTFPVPVDTKVTALITQDTGRVFSVEESQLLLPAQTLPLLRQIGSNQVEALLADAQGKEIDGQAEVTLSKGTFKGDELVYEKVRGWTQQISGATELPIDDLSPGTWKVSLTQGEAVTELVLNGPIDNIAPREGQVHYTEDGAFIYGNQGPLVATLGDSKPELIELLPQAEPLDLLPTDENQWLAAFSLSDPNFFALAPRQGFKPQELALETSTALSGDTLTVTIQAKDDEGPADGLALVTLTQSPETRFWENYYHLFTEPRWKGGQATNSLLSQVHLPLWRTYNEAAAMPMTLKAEANLADLAAPAQALRHAHPYSQVQTVDVKGGQAQATFDLKGFAGSLDLQVLVLNEEQLGQARDKVTLTRPLTLQISAPQYARVGDRFRPRLALVCEREGDITLDWSELKGLEGEKPEKIQVKKGRTLIPLPELTVAEEGRVGGKVTAEGLDMKTEAPFDLQARGQGALAVTTRLITLKKGETQEVPLPSSMKAQKVTLIASSKPSIDAGLIYRQLQSRGGFDSLVARGWAALSEGLVGASERKALAEEVTRQLLAAQESTGLWSTPAQTAVVLPLVAELRRQGSMATEQPLAWAVGGLKAALWQPHSDEEEALILWALDQLDAAPLERLKAFATAGLSPKNRALAAAALARHDANAARDLIGAPLTEDPEAMIWQALAYDALGDLQNRDTQITTLLAGQSALPWPSLDGATLAQAFQFLPALTGPAGSMDVTVTGQGDTAHLTAKEPKITLPAQHLTLEGQGVVTLTYEGLGADQASGPIALDLSMTERLSLDSETLLSLSAQGLTPGKTYDLALALPALAIATGEAEISGGEIFYRQSQPGVELFTFQARESKACLSLYLKAPYLGSAAVPSATLLDPEGGTSTSSATILTVSDLIQ